ncbi:sensor histidine kinase [Vaginisenegalia massiliensis]|uniref:sensor histidine kinase n=1 Tax=Vaginisenegalia massiliensis TaxID=2058294 RepID=UPI000F52DEF3|nr:HAMP domain-containing sensor histidine kinase [Vaginisenegalia massiliensis]
MILYLLSAIILIMVIYLYLIRRAIRQLTQAIQDKLASQSRVAILNKQGIGFMDGLITAYNDVFTQMEESQALYQQERQMLDQTIHNISHDIRTPLTVSWGYAKQLLKDDPDNPQLIKIDDSLGRVSQRLEYLLEYQNLLEQNVQPAKQRFSFSQLVGEQTLSFYDTYQRLHLQVELDLEEGIQIENDPQILERIMQNILGNVAKHGRDFVRIHLYCHQGRVYLQVKNKSKTPIVNITRLTQRFYAEDLSSSEKSSGLGLYITEQLVHLTGGQLELTYQEPNFTIQASWPINIQ